MNRSMDYGKERQFKTYGDRKGTSWVLLEGSANTPPLFDFKKVICLEGASLAHQLTDYQCMRQITHSSARN